MKIFDSHFIGGTIIKGLGLASLLVGIVLLIPPTEYVGLAAFLMICSVPMIYFGHVLAKNTPPPASKVTIRTLRKAGLLDNDKKQK